MCQSKANGGRRCAAHAVSDFAKSIVSKRATIESVTNKAEDVIISPAGKSYYEQKSQELISTGSQNTEKANRNVAFLKAVKSHQTELSAPVSVIDELPEMDYMSETDKGEYSQLNSNVERKQWWDKKAEEDKVIMEEATNDWRNDKLAYYDRLSMPSEHSIMAGDKNMPMDYLRIIAVTTMDKKTRKLAIANYAKQRGVPADVVEAEFGEAKYDIEESTNEHVKQIEDENDIVEKENQSSQYEAKKAKRKQGSFLVRLFKRFW